MFVSLLLLSDAKYCKARLLEKRDNGAVNEAVRQLAFADTILLNKTDLVNKDTLDENLQLIRSINSTAAVHKTTKSRIDLSLLLDSKSFDPEIAKKTMASLDPNGSLVTHSMHDVDIGTVFFMVSGKLDLEKTKHHIAVLLDEFGREQEETEGRGNEERQWKGDAPARQIYRMKGLVVVEGAARPYVLQAVGELFELDESETLEHDEEEIASKFVVIGRGLRKQILQKSFEACLSQAE